MAEQGGGNNFSSPDTFASAMQNAPEGDDSHVVPRELFDTHSSEGTSTEGGSPPGGYRENFQNHESETFNLGGVMQEDPEAGDDNSVSDSEGSQDEEEGEHEEPRDRLMLILK
jgi:hypothetical protein